MSETAAITDAPVERFGRPPKLTDEKARKLVEHLEAGNYLETAASLVGINRQSIRNWCREGARIIDSGVEPKDKHEELLVYFLGAVEKAMATGEAKDLARIDSHADKQWQAAAWRLERRFPERYGQRTVSNVQHGGRIKLVVRHEVMGQGPAQEAIEITPDE